MTEQKLERPESRNDRRTGTSGKLEPPGKLERLGKPGQVDCSQRQYISATKHAALIGDADRIKL